MIATNEWQYVYYERFRPQLFDLRNDPQELVDLGEDAGHRDVADEMVNRFFEWSRQRRTRVTTEDADVERLSFFAGKRLLGLW